MPVQYSIEEMYSRENNIKSIWLKLQRVFVEQNNRSIGIMQLSVNTKFGKS